MNHGEFKSNVHYEPLGKFDLCIEIGCYVGATSSYIARVLLNDNGKLICVDPLTDQYANTDITEEDKINNEGKWKYFAGQYDKFIKNTGKLDNIELIRKISIEAYPDLLKKYEGQVDFIYIDGDHREEPVYLDGVNSFKLCRKGGYILFDDAGGYSKKFNPSGNNGWGDGCCRRGIDRFLIQHIGKYTPLIQNKQLLIQKK